MNQIKPTVSEPPPTLRRPKNVTTTRLASWPEVEEARKRQEALLESEGAPEDMVVVLRERAESVGGTQHQDRLRRLMERAAREDGFDRETLMRLEVEAWGTDER